MAFQMISENYLNISMAQQLIHFLQIYLVQLQMYFWKYPEELKIQKKSANIAEISKRFPEEIKKGNSKRQYEKRHFTLKKANIKPTTVKTPRREEAPQEILLRDTPETIHPIKLESFDVKNIQKASVRIQGGSRPSGMDVDDCKRILTSKKIGKS